MRLTIATIAMLIPVAAHAAATALRVDDPHPPDQPVATSSVYVTVTPAPGDVGLPGAVYLGVKDPSTGEWDYLTGGRWVKFQGGLVTPTARYGAIPASVEFTLARHQNLCALTDDRSEDLYAGYGVLNQQTQQLVQVYAAHVTSGITADHIALTYEAHDMAADPGKYWKILSISCPTD